LAVSFPPLPLLNAAFAAGDMPMGGGGGGKVQKNGPTSDTQQGPTPSSPSPPPEQGAGPTIIQPPEEDEGGGGDTGTSTSTSPTPTVCPADFPDCTIKHKKNPDGTSEETYEGPGGNKEIRKIDSNNKVVEETTFDSDGRIFTHIKFSPNGLKTETLMPYPDGSKFITVWDKNGNLISSVEIASDGRIIDSDTTKYLPDKSIKSL
jgi:hypothetical protein